MLHACSALFTAPNPRDSNPEWTRGVTGKLTFVTVIALIVIG